MIYLNAEIEQCNPDLFYGRILEIKGFVVEGTSEDEVKNKLNKGVRVKMAYDSGLDISKVINAKSNCNCDNFKAIKGSNNFQLAI